MAGIGVQELIVVIIIFGLMLVPLGILVMLFLGRRSTPHHRNPNLKPCPDCGHAISQRAATCPQCGAPVSPLGYPE